MSAEYKIELEGPWHGSLKYGTCDDRARARIGGKIFETVRPTEKEAVADIARQLRDAGHPDGPYRVDRHGRFRWRGDSIYKAAKGASPYYVMQRLRPEAGTACEVGDSEYLVRTDEKPEAHLAAALLDAGMPDGPWVLTGLPGYNDRRGGSLRELVAEVDL